MTFRAPTRDLAFALKCAGHSELMASAFPDLDEDTVQAVLGTDSPWPGGRVVLGLDARPRELLLKRHRNSLIGVFAFGVALTMGLSAMVIRRGLAPVTRLSAQPS